MQDKHVKLKHRGARCRPIILGIELKGFGFKTRELPLTPSLLLHAHHLHVSREWARLDNKKNAKPTY